MLGVAVTGLTANIAEAPQVVSFSNDETGEPAASAARSRSVDAGALVLAPEPILVARSAPSTFSDVAPPAAEPERVIPRGYLTEAQVRALALEAGWSDWEIPQLLDVAYCESTLNSNAINGRIYGLMQIHHMWFGYAGYSLDEWSNPLVNLLVARVVYEYDLANGNAPWTQWQCRPGGYRVPSEEFSPTVPVEVSGANEDAEGVEPGAEPTPDPATPENETGDEPTVTSTPAPWDEQPSWPPPVGTEEPGAATPTAEATTDPAATQGSGGAAATE